MEIRIYQDGEFINITIDVNNIREFNIFNSKTYTTKGTFKTWVKDGYIRMNDGKGYKVKESVIKELKEVLKGKYTTTKNTNYEYKNGSERKATDWTYIINNPFAWNETIQKLTDNQ